MKPVDRAANALTRRQLLHGAVSGAGLFALAACTRSSAAGRSVASTTTAEATRSGTISGPTRAGALVVPPHHTLRFDPSVDTTLELTGNLVVLGRLELRPDPGVEHVLRFVDVDESAFVGGGMDPIDSDVGLWVMGNGQLDILGGSKTAWNVTGDAADWLAEDELVVAPVDAGDFTPKPFTRGDPVPTFGEHAAEVLNLTRSVQIEGTPDGRAHVFIRSNQPQSVRYAALRYLGPRQPDGGSTTGVLGRYGLHFHHAHDGSRGSVVEGVVVRDCGAHAFVPHMSHGITIRDCISYETFDEAYWWDPGDPTDDLLIERCVAASVYADPEVHGYRLAGFVLGLGQGLKLRRCVTFAVQGNKNAGGYIWPEAPSGLWDFTDNVAHNNSHTGIFVWQNNSTPQTIDGFTAYNNGECGIRHGAYQNAFHYANLDLRDQPMAIQLIASGRRDPSGQPMSWTDVQATDLVVQGHSHLLSVDPVLFLRCSFTQGITVADAAGEAGPLDFVDCDLRPQDFAVSSMNPSTVIRVQDAGGPTFELTTRGSTAIRPFYS